jgi:hypothetical protein
MSEPDDDGHLRRTFIRVMSVQVVTLALLWLLQQRFGR